MDPVGLIYYGLVCGCLSLAGGRIAHPALRFGIGVAVGVVAVTILPLLRGSGAY